MASTTLPPSERMAPTGTSLPSRVANVAFHLPETTGMLDGAAAGHLATLLRGVGMGDELLFAAEFQRLDCVGQRRILEHRGIHDGRRGIVATGDAGFVEQVDHPVVWRVDDVQRVEDALRRIRFLFVRVLPLPRR